ncbi:MAG: tripartite tricarboxylate transporter substrate binding protein, partial [Deltaproteobacteria bacterium]|nr:tripartite tricarboxylate transporter substrate binding protein [Deltaproteobacteria bacterium]
MRKSGLCTLAGNLLVSLALVLTLCLGILPASAEYPERAITIVVPYPPGGVTDLGARALAEALEKGLKQPVVVVNKAGGATTIGGNAVVTAKPDGYTLGFFPSSASIPEVYTYFYQAPYSGKDLRPVAKVAIPVLTISVKGDSPINSVKDFVAF